jgi:mitochondrial fission protein ELM1
MTHRPRVWLLLGHRRGDNNQVLALGEALGVPFETRTMAYRRLAKLILRIVPSGLLHLRSSSRERLQPPWPDLVIGVGYRTVPVARWIRKQSGGRTKLVRIGNPRAPSDLFDLIVTTPQYPVQPGENVLALPLAMNRFGKPPTPVADEEEWLAALPRPHLLLSIGGPAAMWRLDLAALRDAAATLAKRVEAEAGTLIVVGSPRTPAEAWSATDEAISGSSHAVRAPPTVRYPVLLADADEQFVTADSVSMISEAILSGKPVGLVPIEPDARGRHRLGADPPDRTRLRDPRRFWQAIARKGLAGTVEEPKRGDVEDPVETAVAAVRERLGGLFE